MVTKRTVTVTTKDADGQVLYEATLTATVDVNEDDMLTTPAAPYDGATVSGMCCLAVKHALEQVSKGVVSYED